MPRFLIVNADDFNLTPGVSRGVLEAHRRGIVTSTTVMVNLPELEKSRDLAREAPGLGLGLHLNLTFGPPVLPAAQVASLVNGTGRFVRDRRRLEAKGALSEIRAEFAAQAGRFEAVFGGRPSHLDTHHHVHRYPRVLEVVLELAAGLGLPVRALTPEMAAAIGRRGLESPDRLVGDIAAEAYWTPARLLALAETLPEGVTELMCHPGYADAALAASSYRAQREGELAALCDDRVRRALEAAGIRRIGYAELPGVSAGRE